MAPKQTRGRQGGSSPGGASRGGQRRSASPQGAAMTSSPSGRGGAASGRRPRTADDESGQVRAQFGSLDTDGDGTLSFVELKGLLKKVNPSLSENQLQKLFCEIDSNQNGKIEVREFLDFVMDNKRTKPEVLREPPQRGTSPAQMKVRDRWKKETLAAHNERRALHDCSALTWSDECYRLAKLQADNCQEKGSLFHDNYDGPSGRHGQNGFWCSNAGSSADAVVESWYDELTDPGYDFEAGNFKPGTGHFTQVVWKDTTSVGMAVSEDGRFAFANYLPAGNMQGSFEENVPPLVGSPSAALRDKKSASAAKADVAKANPTIEEIREVSADSMTPELEGLFEDCPFEQFKEKVEAAFEKGNASVSVKREESGGSSVLTVTIVEGGGRGSRRMSGSWGGG